MSSHFKEEKKGMDMDLKRIIQCIEQGDQDSLQAQLHDYNTEYAQCFFFDAEERKRRKQQELEEFRRNKVRSYVPDSDSDSDCDDPEDPDLILRQAGGRPALDGQDTDAETGVEGVPAHTAYPFPGQACPEAPGHRHGHPHTGQTGRHNFTPPVGGPCAEAGVLTDTPPVTDCATDPRATAEAENADTHTEDADPNSSPDADITEKCSNYVRVQTRRQTHSVLIRGKKDSRGGQEEKEKGKGDAEVLRTEALKALCNIIYNSQWAQDRASKLRLLSGLLARLAQGAPPHPSGHFHELRILFLLTALRPELRTQLQLEGGVSILTAALEHCLSVQWKEGYEELTETTALPVTTEAADCAIEILKTPFNITYSLHGQEPDDDDAAVYRHLAAVLRHCLLLHCEQEESGDELKGHTVNLLSALPLQCLDVLLSAPLSEGSKEWKGINMDCVHTLLLFMERQLDRGHKLKEKLIPVLNLLTESCRAHRQTRHYLQQQILPPLRDVSTRPEQGNTVKSRLVRLMTHVDTDVKDCAAELLFVLCKENVRRFVKYTGYGNAAGLLAARGMLSGPKGATTVAKYSSDSDSDTEEYKQAKGRINPVTGRVEEEQPDPMEGMTEEEKEVEAHRLISLFNRLSWDNVIQPMGVTPEGGLVPMSDQLRECTLEEEGESEAESEGDTQ